jgi:hypothetical protein
MQTAWLLLAFNAILFQVGWFLCILCGSYWALLYTTLGLALHIYWCKEPRTELLAIVLAIFIGLVHDSILIRAGYIQFQESVLWSPVWLMCLWALLGATLNHSLHWLYRYPVLSAGFGALGGTLSYLAGVTLSPAQWSSPLTEVIPIIAIFWLFILPLHRFLSIRIKPYVSQ